MYSVTQILFIISFRIPLACYSYICQHARQGGKISHRIFFFIDVLSGFLL